MKLHMAWLSLLTLLVVLTTAVIPASNQAKRHDNPPLPAATRRIPSTTLFTGIRTAARVASRPSTASFVGGLVAVIPSEAFSIDECRPNCSNWAETTPESSSTLSFGPWDRWSGGPLPQDEILTSS